MKKIVIITLAMLAQLTTHAASNLAEKLREQDISLRSLQQTVPRGAGALANVPVPTVASAAPTILPVEAPTTSSWWQKAWQTCKAGAGELWSGAQEHKGKIAAAAGLATAGYLGWRFYKSYTSIEQRLLRAVRANDAQQALYLLRHFHAQIRTTPQNFYQQTAAATQVFNDVYDAAHNAELYDLQRLLTLDWVDLNLAHFVQEIKPQGAMLTTIDWNPSALKETDDVNDVTQTALTQLTSKLKALRQEGYNVDNREAWRRAIDAAHNIVDKRIRDAVNTWLTQSRAPAEID